KGYIEIHIDRQKAARYGIQVGDIQDVVEVALGGRPVTTTVEQRERYPVRIRYARAFRDDVEALKRILIASRGPMSASTMDAPTRMSSRPPPPATPPLQVPLAEVAEVRVVEGPAMIKSENGRLRAYVQASVRDRDEIGFVEQAQRVVEQSVSLP